MQILNKILRAFFFGFFIRPLVLIVVGINLRHRDRLPENGPAILVANHNSHLDTMVLMTLFPFKLLRKLRPVAAADYFLKYPFIAWFSTKIIGIIPIARKKPEGAATWDPLAGVATALDNKEIVIFYPEGSRGEPEQMTKFKSGIAVISERFPDVPIVPIYLHGLGKILPKGEAILVPFFCDVYIGESMKWTGDKNDFLEKLKKRLEDLAAEDTHPTWY